MAHDASRLDTKRYRDGMNFFVDNGGDIDWGDKTISSSFAHLARQGYDSSKQSVDRRITGMKILLAHGARVQFENEGMHLKTAV